MSVRLALVIACALGLFMGLVIGADNAREHHGVDEICKAFPPLTYPRPVEYVVSGPQGTIATGGCA